MPSTCVLGLWRLTSGAWIECPLHACWGRGGMTSECPERDDQVPELNATLIKKIRLRTGHCRLFSHLVLACMHVCKWSKVQITKTACHSVIISRSAFNVDSTHKKSIYWYDMLLIKETNFFFIDKSKNTASNALSSTCYDFGMACWKLLRTNIKRKKI